MQQGVENITYATALFNLALTKPQAKIGLAAVGKSKNLLQRIQLLSSYRENEGNRRTIFGLAAAFIVLIASTILQPMMRLDRKIAVINESSPNVRNVIVKNTTNRSSYSNSPSVSENSEETKNKLKNKIHTSFNQNKSTKGYITLADKDETKDDFANATAVNFDVDKNKTVALLQEENSDGTVTMMAVEIKMVNGNNRLTPLWRWQTKPVSIDSIRKTIMAGDSLKKYQ